MSESIVFLKILEPSKRDTANRSFERPGKAEAYHLVLGDRLLGKVNEITAKTR